MTNASSPPLDNADPAAFLGSDATVQSDHAGVAGLARDLRAGARSSEAFAESAYTWVRDEVAHSFDARDRRVTLTASEVLEHRVGLCYAKSHLLAAMLRSQGVPTALCYQLLDDGSEGLVLHGLVAVHLRDGWHRLDPRGNKDGVDAQFSLDDERLAWTVDTSRGERDYPTLYAAPAACVVEALRGAEDMLDLYESGLPSSLG